MTLFRCRGLTRAPWFQDFELELEAGEIAVVSGPNGSGKTLLLRALADLDPVDAGTCELDGEDRDSLPATQWRRRVLYVHQRAPSVGATVAQDLARIAGLEAQARFRHGSETPAGLDPDASTATLSGGERQRLALERALRSGPDVLLLDETTSQLDPTQTRAAEDLVRAFADAGGCVLWVSHEPGLAERIGARRVRFPQ